MSPILDHRKHASKKEHHLWGCKLRYRLLLFSARQKSSLSK